MATKVYIRLIFQRIGEIDTLNEKYQAQASIESRWSIDFNRLVNGLSPEDQENLRQGKSVTLTNYAQNNWHPQLYIENVLGEMKEQVRYSARKSKHDQQFYVCEHREIRGIFWEKLELYHFPSDVQDLSISIASQFYDDKVQLIADPHYLSGVNREAFVDQQEWTLYEHVDTQQRFVREFLYDDLNDNDEDGNSSNFDDRKRPILTVTCHAARQSNYFYWNGYCLIFLITIVSFCVFGIPAHLAANRLQITCTLLLTSITFRWTVNRSLPTISYLTTLDKYAILCIINLIVHCLWHGIMGALAFLTTTDFRLTPSMRLTKVDQTMFFVSVGLFLVIHVCLLVWLFFVPLGVRRKMRRIDEQYRSVVIKGQHRVEKRSSISSSHRMTGFQRVPISQ